MSQTPNERVAYFNGEIMPESQVRLSFRDAGFKFGDAVFDLARTFGGRPFKLEQHIERLYRSLAYVRIDPGMDAATMLEISQQVLDINKPLIEPGSDYWVGQRVSRGLERIAGEPPDHDGPSVIIECTPIPFRSRAHHFRDGIEVAVSSVRRTSPASLSPRAKTHNYLNLIMANLEVQSRAPDAWAVLLDENGNLCEGMGSNLFIVRDGALHTPKEDYVLPGVSRQTVIELAAEIGLPFHERDLAVFDAHTADEMFLTSTSLCLCPVASINGARIGDGGIPGPVTQKLIDAYAKLVDYDFVGQYLAYLDS